MNSFLISYRNIAGSPRETIVYGDTVIDAVNQFNDDPITGGGHPTPLRVSAYYGKWSKLRDFNNPAFYGEMEAAFLGEFYLEGRYGVPKVNRSKYYSEDGQPNRYRGKNHKGHPTSWYAV